MKTLAQYITEVPKGRAFKPVAVFVPWVVCVAVALVVQYLAPAVVNEYWQSVLQRMGVFIIAAVSLNIVNGFTGQFSMGHAGFMAIGGYIGAGVTFYGSLLMHGSVNDPSFAVQGTMLMLAGIVAGACVAAAAGYLVGLPSLRLRGDYLAIVTLGFGEIIRVILELTPQQINEKAVGRIAGMLQDPSPASVKMLVLDPTTERISAMVREPSSQEVTAGIQQGELIATLQRELASADVQALQSLWAQPLATLAKIPLNGSTGFTGTPPYATLFWVWLFVAITCVVAYRMKTSSSGRAFLSIREDEVAARAMGVDLTKYKVRAFVLAAFFGGVAGALYSHIGANPSPTDAGFQRSFDIIIMVVLGGLGSVSGSVLAAIILVLMPELLRDLNQYRLVLYALLLIVMMLVRPQGLFGVKEIWDLSRGERKQLKKGGSA